MNADRGRESRQRSSLADRGRGSDGGFSGGSRGGAGFSGSRGGGGGFQGGGGRGGRR